MRIALRHALASLIAVSAIAITVPARAADPDDGAFIPAPEGPPLGDGAEPTPAPGDAPVAAGLAGPPSDVYLVTQTYVGDVIASDGGLTIYRTVTASETPGTYARPLQTVATGAPSAFDGAAFNGRATRSDGRAVAGTYYQTFVLTGEGLVPVSVVFFQDDSERAPRADPAAASIGTRAGVPFTRASGGPGGASPGAIVGGVSLVPGGAIVERIDVLRGRAVRLWFGAAVAGAPAAVRGWRVISAEGAAVGVPSGSAAEPLVARWDRLAPPGAAWRVVVALMLSGETEAPAAVAMVEVVVRSPALAE